MRLAFWRLRMVSPTKKTLTVSAFMYMNKGDTASAISFGTNSFKVEQEASWSMALVHKA